jgi:DNA-binding PucR family transcriptional regulator
MTALRSATSIRDALVHPLEGGSTIVWLGRGLPWDARAAATVRSVLAASGLVACLAEPGRGVDGLRAGLAQALKVRQIRDAWAASGAPDVPRVLSHAEVGLEVLLLQDDAVARRFVLAELGCLSQDSAEAARLRETLAASLRFSTHVAAAEHLQVHEHTVRNRLQKIETLVGHPAIERRTEMQVALRLLRLLAPQR